jgi:ABC-type nitrate/sulfonate/bicarbonate transport system ATPase subunit
MAPRRFRLRGISVFDTLHESRGALSVENLSKHFESSSGRVHALEGISFSLQLGEIVGIVGHSGCGKSTLLRIIGGLDAASDGHVTFGGINVCEPGRDRGFVFQEHRLFPWLSVARNVLASLDGALLSKDQKLRRAEEMIELVGLSAFKDAYPSQLSGGMLQRVALARALTAGPDLLLLDEPFAALDAFNKMRLQQEVLRIWERSPRSILLVTHDLEEAIYLCDRILVFAPSPGRLQAIVDVDLPRPRDRTHADFSAIRRRLMRELELDS